MDVLSRLIREARQAKHLNQQQLADKLHRTVQTVNRWENGRGRVGKKSLAELCRILGLDAAEIVRLRYSEEPAAPFLDSSKQVVIIPGTYPESVQDAMQTAEWRILSPAPDEIEMVCTMTGYEGAGLRDADAVLKVIRELPWRRIKALFDENKVPGDKQEECIRLCRAIINDWRTQDRKLNQKEETGK